MAPGHWAPLSPFARSLASCAMRFVLRPESMSWTRIGLYPDVTLDRSGGVGAESELVRGLGVLTNPYRF